MKEFQRGDNVRIKRLNELNYTEQDSLMKSDLKMLGLQAVFMFYEEDGGCVVSIERASYKVPQWILTNGESKQAISRTFSVETYQRINHKELIERIAYLTSKTACNFKVEQGQKEIKIYIEK